jgi:hypothetical protein
MARASIRTGRQWRRARAMPILVPDLMTVAQGYPDHKAAAMGS